VNLHCETEDATNTNPAGAMLIGALLLHELQNCPEKKKKKGRERELRNGFVEEIYMAHQTSC
jgi:hypothetical protein